MSGSEIGLIGLGTMGAALALNIAEKGFRIAVWNRTSEKTRAFVAGAGPLAAQITATETLEDLVAALAPPRAIILMVPAGQAVDDQIAALAPLLDEGDLIVDAGNANFRDTDRRVAEAPVRVMGIGVSGGEDGARHGPSIMAGGSAADWARMEPVLTAIAARHEGVPCAGHVGPAGAGHFVKAVHNGIEYADMQLIAEVYGLMRDGLGMDAGTIGSVFDAWNAGVLRSYLIEISGKVAGTTDAATGGPLLDVIVDAAGQKGTGRWTAIEAQHLGTPVPVIEAAVAARNMSAQRDRRARLAERFGGSAGTLPDLPREVLEQALICGKVLCYVQGFDMIRAASDAFGWGIDPSAVARLWRAGCIIRSDMLDDMAAALERHDSLLGDAGFADRLTASVPALRQVIAGAVTAGLPVPALSAALGYFDTMRQARGTANMIQGQRDFFGLHGFARLDTGASGQHGPWA